MSPFFNQFKPTFDDLKKIIERKGKKEVIP